MLVTFETMTMGKQKQWQGHRQGNGNDNLDSFVVLAMVKALAMAKNVVSLVVCTMAKTLINNACIHVQIVSEQLLAAEDKLKHKAAVAYVLQQHVALPMVTKAMAKGKSQGNDNDKLVPFVVLARVTASAMAKDVVLPLACTMAKTVGSRRRSSCIQMAAATYNIR